MCYVIHDMNFDLIIHLEVVVEKENVCCYFMPVEVFSLLHVLLVISRTLALI